MLGTRLFPEKMAAKFRRMRDFYRVLPQFRSSNFQLQSRRGMNLFASHLNPLPQLPANITGSFADRGCCAQRFSTVSETSHEVLPEEDLLSFIESTLNDIEGPCHCWLNRVEDGKDICRRNGVFLILVGAFLEDSLISGCNPVTMFEKVKSLKQRYPKLHVIGFQFSSSIFADAVQTHIAQITMREHITFPILLSNKNFTEDIARCWSSLIECPDRGKTGDGPNLWHCLHKVVVPDMPYLVACNDFKIPALYYEKDMDLGIINRAIKELVQQNENNRITNNTESTWVKQIEVFKEPLVCCSLRNLFLHFPGCISVDEGGDRLFLSDVNHHRVIIFDGNGKILDCIGSSPGFEDGEFESSKLMRPAASFYHATEDCLYFVDSENHAVRRADMERRVVETVYPTGNANKRDSSLWGWIMNKLWKEKEFDTKSEDLDSESFLFPWHLIKSLDDDLFIFNQSFETLWIMDLASGVIKGTAKGFPKILEICGQLILEKSSLMEHIPGDWLHHQVDNKCSFDQIPYAGLLSSLANFQDYIVICDTVGQRVLKLSKESGFISSFELSNFGILGLPYWVSSPLEKVYVVGNALPGVHVDHSECFSLLPGRIDMQLNIDIPADIVLVEPLQEGCVWRQARGAATEVSGAESGETSVEKVGAAQQWYDELDNLAFSTPEVELSTEEENNSNGNIQEGRVCIDCAVHTSPGTSEVIIFAALYLKLKRNLNSCEDSKEKKAARIADILNPKRAGRMGRGGDQCIQILMKSNRDLEELVFMKPLHVRLRIDCGEHPKAADNSKEIILTDSSIEVNISL